MIWLLAISLALLLAPTSAHAEPFTVALVGLLGEGGFIVAMGALKTIFYSGMVINGVMTARRQKKAARAAYESSLKDRAIVIRSSDAPRPIIYGRARASGPLVYACSSGTYSENLHLVIPLAAHEIDAIEDIWFNDESIGALDGNGWVTGGRYAKTRQEYATKVVTSLPGSGIITLDHTPDSVASVAVNTGTDNGYESVAFSVAGNQVTISSAYAGMWVNVTYYYTVATPLVRVKKFLGITAGERDTDLETASGGQWTANHLGKGVPRIHVTLVYDPDVFPSGIPNISAIVRGKKVLDTRSSTTTWSTNPALVARDYIVDPLGFGESSAAINTSLVSAAANICDELVPGYETNTGVRVSSSIKRYECNGIISTDDDRIENLGILLSSMVGTSVYSGGSWLIRAGAYVSPVLSLTESDLAGGAIQVQPAASRRDLFNSVRGRFIDPSKGWQVDDFPTYASATYTAADNGESLWRDIVLGMETNAGRAQRLAKLTLHRARQGLTFSANFKLSAYRLQPGDTFYFSSDFFGWSNKVFRVVDRKLRQPGIISLVIQEEAAAVYDWDFSEDATPDPAPNTTLPDPRDVPDIANLVASSGSSIYRILADGTQQPLMRLTWDAVTDVSVTNGGRIEVYVKRASDVVAQPYAVLQGTDTGIDVAPVSRDETYNVMVRAVNGIGVRGAWAVVTHTVSSGAIVNSAGPVAKLLRLVATSQVFQVDKTGTPSPASITLTAEAQNDTSAITWSVITGTATLVGTGNTRTLAYTDMATDYVTVQVEQSGRTDFLTIVKVFAGVDGDDGATGPAGPPGADGADGADGAPGERGSLTGYGSQYGISTSSWSDGLANRVINNMLTGASLTTTLATTTHLRIGDMVTLDNGSTWAQMRYWSGIGWVQPGVIIDGNLLVNGTISGDKIAGTTITGSKIAAGTIAAGNMAANSITAANAALANAAVTTAKIADLNVTTLKIGNNAVTIPVSATGGSVALSSVYQTICSVGATLTGAALIILAQVSLDRLSSSTSRAIVQIRIRRSDTWVYAEREFDAPLGDPGTSLPGRDSPTIIVSSDSLNGYAVYSIDARLSYGVNVTAASSALGLIEARR